MKFFSFGKLRTSALKSFSLEEIVLDILAAKITPAHLYVNTNDSFRFIPIFWISVLFFPVPVFKTPEKDYFRI